MNVVYFVKRPLTERDVQRFGIAAALTRGHGVTVIDMSDLLHPESPNDRSGMPSHPGLECRFVGTWQEFARTEDVCRRAQMAFLLIQSFGLSRATLRPLRLLARLKVPYAMMAPALYPGAQLEPAKVRRTQRLRDLFTRLGSADPVTSLLARLDPRLSGVPHATWYICNSERNKTTMNRLVGRRTRIIAAHTADYEQYRKIVVAPGQTGDLAVFIDQFLPYHPDFPILGAHELDDSAYYAALCRLFERIEAELGLEVVVAAHPRADYAKHPGIFGGRRVVAGRTAELIAASRLVLAHTSTAIGFAVLCRRPLMLLTSRALYSRHVYEKYTYEGLATELETPLRFFDDPAAMDLKDCLTVNDTAYRRYVDAYLRCNDAPDRPMWDTIWDTISGGTRQANVRRQTAATIPPDVGIAEELPS